MQTLTAGAAAISLVLLAACTPRAEDEPRAAVAAFQQALLAGDGPRALELLAPDVLIYEFGSQEASRDEYAASHLKADIEALAGATVQQLDQRQVIDGDIAVVTTRSRMTGKGGGKPFDLLGTETMVLRRHGGNWRITHIHWSARDAGKK